LTRFRAEPFSGSFASLGAFAPRQVYDDLNASESPKVGFRASKPRDRHPRMRWPKGLVAIRVRG
jgi:hypothetical protein